MERVSHCTREKELEKSLFLLLLAPKRERSSKSHFFQLFLKNEPIMPYNERYLLVFLFWHFPKATPILRTLIGRTSSIVVLDHSSY